MEKFTVVRTIAGWMTIPEDRNNCPLLTKLHRDEGDHVKINRVLDWKSLEDGIDRIRLVGLRTDMFVRVCGDIKNRPTVILRERFTVVEEIAKPFEKMRGYDAASWGVTSFYEEEENWIRDAIANGGPFDTDWYSVKKEIQTGRISRDKRNGPIWVQVSQCMDEAHDLVDTAIWSAAGGNEFCSCGYDFLNKKGLNEEEIYEVIDTIAEACELGEDNCAQSDRLIHWKCGFDRVCDALNEAADDTGNELENWYQSVVETAKYYLENLNE